MLRTTSDCVNLSPSTVDELMGRALEIRDLCAGAAALLRETSHGALRELVARARNASGAALRQLCEKFKAEYQGDGLADVKHYRRQAWSVLKCHVLPVLGDKPAADVRPADIHALKDVLGAAKRSPWVISRALRQLGRVFNWAIERELLTSNRARSKPIGACWADATTRSIRCWWSTTRRPRSATTRACSRMQCKRSSTACSQGTTAAASPRTMCRRGGHGSRRRRRDLLRS
jgi:hypothetical protein